MIRQHLDHARRLGGLGRYLWLWLHMSLDRREYVWSRVEPIYLMHVDEGGLEHYDLALNPALIALGFAECEYCRHCDFDVDTHGFCLRELNPEAQLQRIADAIQDAVEKPREPYRLVEIDYHHSIVHEDGNPGGLSDIVSTSSRRVLWWTRSMTASQAADYAKDHCDDEELEPPNDGDLLQGETAYRLEVFRDGKWIYAHHVSVPSKEGYYEDPEEVFFDTL